MKALMAEYTILDEIEDEAFMDMINEIADSIVDIAEKHKVSVTGIVYEDKREETGE